LTIIIGGNDYDHGPYNVTFPAGETIISFDVSIFNDNTMEGVENFNLIINPSSLPSGVIVGDPGQVTVTIVDDECKYVLEFTAHIWKIVIMGISELYT